MSYPFCFKRDNKNVKSVTLTQSLPRLIASFVLRSIRQSFIKFMRDY